jgi:superoxide dismutase, Cu-Zn family
MIRPSEKEHSRSRRTWKGRKKMKGLNVVFCAVFAALLAVLCACSDAECADEIVIAMNRISADGVGKEIGTVTARDSRFGLLLVPSLNGLPPGIHGFHIHENPDCGSAVKDGRPTAGAAAGGHYDPEKTGRHEGPYGSGHLGDLPVLHVKENGTADIPVLAPRLTVSDIKGRSLVIHAGGDNYSDTPEKLGGGGGRIACGVAAKNR